MATTPPKQTGLNSSSNGNGVAGHGVAGRGDTLELFLAKANQTGRIHVQLIPCLEFDELECRLFLADSITTRANRYLDILAAASGAKASQVALGLQRGIL